MYDLSGRRFGRLSVLHRVPTTVKKKVITWLCRCDCGERVPVQSNNLLEANTRSCGCLQRDATKKRLTTHGEKHSIEYRIFHAAKNRCRNPRNPKWRIYGARGIRFKFRSITHFLQCIGRRPAKNLSLDRIDNDGHYEPGNVRWATRSQQMRNRRPKKFWTMSPQ